MYETRKTNNIRSKEFFEEYLSGKIIDIGAGRDLVCPGAERFDIEDGDANYITKHRDIMTYDGVHSSHCLEHMLNPRSALNEWWQLLKPGGYLVLVVPEEDLYEQGIWPSRFNRDHKVTFRLRRKETWSPVSYDIEELVKELPDVKIVSAEIQDNNYDYHLQSKYPPRPQKQPTIFIRILIKLIRNTPIINHLTDKHIDRYEVKHCNLVVDQTRRNALAQIQIVARKVKA